MGDHDDEDFEGADVLAGPLAPSYVNGCLLSPLTTEIPDGISYAYVRSADDPNGKALVCQNGDLKYSFRMNTETERSVLLRNGTHAQLPTLNGPKIVDKKTKKLVSSPLPQSWFITADGLTYEQFNAVGHSVATSEARPLPPLLFTSKLPIYTLLRRQAEIVMNPIHGGDSNGYLSLVGVKERDVQFAKWFGLPVGWPTLCFEKKVDDSSDDWEHADENEDNKSLDRSKYWKAMGGPLVVATDHDKPISTSGNHIIMSTWYDIGTQVADAIEIIQFVGSVTFRKKSQGGGIFEDSEESDGTAKCCALQDGRVTGGTRKLDKKTPIEDKNLPISTSGNHIIMSTWYDIGTQVADAIEIIQFVGSVTFRKKSQGGGIFEDSEESDGTAKCCALQDGRVTGGTRKLDKKTPIEDKNLKDEIKALIQATAPVNHLSNKTQRIPEDTPESLKHGLRLIALQVKDARPRKRKAVGELKVLRSKYKALLAIVTKNDFEDAMVQCVDEDTCINKAEALIGDDAYALFDELDLQEDADLNDQDKKAYGGLVYDKAMADEGQAGDA
eukprot:CAMPEP_0171994250 /NCGR_PEP_ID=MMETSP0993-20121228/278862_1 /TAXON_ID=483369 /ORGANISM="non described non described, Strain CCMP2098" /LENGTH=555 /DNA_ID=CAMNT_0012647325 /DNA_START=94 /DNA_END=1761 /DNA_ORIENTATION=-